MIGEVATNPVAMHDTSRVVSQPDVWITNEA